MKEILFPKPSNRKSAPRWRGPAGKLDIDKAGVTVTFQTQTFKVERRCATKGRRAMYQGSGMELYFGRIGHFGRHAFGVVK